MNLFPSATKDVTETKKVSVRLFGNRLFADQTLYEYLIEFLLIFSSPKYKDGTGADQFHNLQLSEDKLSYYGNTEIGLRRFIFFDKAKRTNTLIDTEAYDRIIHTLKNHMENVEDSEKTDVIESIQDMLHGYAVVIKKRVWCAQMLLPICKSFIFCEAMPKTRQRQQLKWSEEPEDLLKIDKEFAFDKRNFLAKGGEVYYLHLLQALQGQPGKQKQLEACLTGLVENQCEKMNEISTYIQNIWEKEMGYDEPIRQCLNLSSIPATGYDQCGKYAVDELINYLSCSIDPVKRVDILAKGVMLQVMRMMTYRVYDYLHQPVRKWIIDFNNSENITIKKVAVENYRAIEEDMLAAINREADELNADGHLDEKSMQKAIREGKKQSVDLFRARGKDIQCIIPKTGGSERLTISEDIANWLVLSLVKPETQMTYDMFLQRLYETYGMVIGPVEYRKMGETDSTVNPSLCGAFVMNSEMFQKFLEAAGFLRSLSDATAIVVNPYTRLR